jgi:hypothetical protein
MRKLTFSTQHGLMAILMIASCVAFCTAAINNPTPHGQQHKTQSNYWDAIRLRSVKVLSIEGTTVNYQFDDTETLILGSVETDDITKLPKASKRMNASSSFFSTRTR